MIDISVGAIAGLSSVIVASLIIKLDFPVLIALPITLVSGLLLGSLNGMVVTKTKLPALIVSIGSMYIFRSAANWISDGTSVFPLPDFLGKFGSDRILGVSWPFWIFLSVAAISQLILSVSLWGLKVKATGSDRESAWCNEVDVDNVTIQTFGLLGLLSSLAGVLLSFRMITGHPTVGMGWELNAIAACVIGGTSLFGHDGSVVGTVLGIFIIQVLSNGLVMIGVPAHLQQGAVGIIMIVSVAIDFYRRRKLDMIGEFTR
jgi:ribose transport system permease protein